MYDLGQNFKIDLNKSKTPMQFVYKGNKYRISILSNSLVRLEYSETGSFNDYPTFFASNRSFGQPKVSVEEDNELLTIKAEKFVLTYRKERPFIGSKLTPDINLRVSINDTNKIWYFNHPEVRNFGGSAFSLDNLESISNLEKGLFSLDGFTSFDDSRTPLIDQNGNIMAPNYKNLDTYLFIYNNDFGVGLRDYFNLTSLPPLIPRYALGVWWSKNESYSEKDIQSLVNSFRKNEIPFSVLLLGSYARDNTSNISFSFNKGIFPNPVALTNYLHKNNIFFGLKINTEGSISRQEAHFNDFLKIYNLEGDKDTPINVFNSNLMDGFLKGIINPLLNTGIDILWLDDKNKENMLRNFAMNYYLFKNFGLNINKRGLILSRNFGIVPHKYSILYSGETIISWKTLSYLPFFNANSSNIGISWWSHDIGGYKGGIEDSELYMRFVQLGTFSPILRLSSDGGKYYKREPWKWDAKTFNIVKDYLILRHRLIPYLYSEAYKYSSLGIPIIQPLYYKYPETYDEPLYKREYYFGSELFVSPIVTQKDSLMNRVVHRIFLPSGMWYDFKTGKKFPGGRRYVTFYKDEDYPVFAKTGAIIPLAILEKDNLNNTFNPKELEIHVFPGRSNTYKLYEDDGITSKYKQGLSCITEINYFYKENDFSISIERKDNQVNIIPERRNYVVKFRNTKYTDDVKVFYNETSIQFESYVDENDFVIKLKGIPTNGKVLIFCKGRDIEIDASRAINEDFESIISDINVPTDLKIEIDKVMFGQEGIKEKRIAIKKLKKKGLSPIHIDMFIKLLEYLAEI